MEALAAQGNTAEALRVYDELRDLLRDELGTAPSAELQALHRRLLGPGARRPGRHQVNDQLAKVAKGRSGDAPGPLTPS